MTTSKNKDRSKLDDLNNLAAIYRLLSHFYRKEVSPSLVQKLDKSGLLDELERLGYNIDSQKLKDSAFLNDLALEYAKVFIGPGPHLSPYGSIYHPDDQKKGRLWGDTTKWVRRFIMDHGLEFDGKAYDGIPDHISHELEFFSRLAEAEAKARQAGEEEKVERLLNSQRKFFNEQLNKWIPLFCAKVSSSARLSFYKEIARLTNDIIEMEKTRLDELEPESK
jgi:TorA maturation chaperone TorD